MAEKTINEQLTEIQSALEIKAKSDAIVAAQEATKDFNDKIIAAESKAAQAQNEAAELKGQVSILKDAADKNQQAFDKLFLRSKATQLSEPEHKSFNQFLAETIERNKEAIQSEGSKQLINGNTKNLTFSMFTEEEAKSLAYKNKEGQLETKAVGDMTITTNYPGAAPLYQDVRGALIEQPSNRVWLSDILPNSTSSGTQVVYPKESGLGDGGVAAWTDHTQNKAQVDFNIVPGYSKFEWLAGYVIIEREMIDDIPFMTQYLQSRMLISLKKAENGLILNGTANVPGFQQLASPYNGTGYANAVDRALDAALGQIPDATSDFYSGTDIILRRRDLVQKFILNKASGSGEYDLPENAVIYNADGTVTVGTLNVVGTTDMPFNTFYAIDRKTTAFIRRMQPELRLFEDSTLAKLNKLMWRIEERATLVVFRNDAIIKGVLTQSA